MMMIELNREAIEKVRIMGNNSNQIKTMKFLSKVVLLNI